MSIENYLMGPEFMERQNKLNEEFQNSILVASKNIAIHYCNGLLREMKSRLENVRTYEHQFLGYQMAVEDLERSIARLSEG